MRRALVVGLNDYPQKGAQLYGAINDATEVKKLLEKHGDNFPNFEVEFLTKATRSELMGAIKRLFTGGSEIEISLFYFSGHGFINEVGGYIVTQDAELNDEGIFMDSIINVIKTSGVQNKIILLDCCHSGAFGNYANAEQTTIGNGVTILTSSKSVEKSFEINGHGVFTNLLLEALRGGAADIRGFVTAGSIYAFIDQSLGAYDQRPVFKTNINRFVAIRRVTPAVPPEILLQITDLFQSPNDEHKLDPSYEDTNDPKVLHEYIEPYSNPENVKKFKILQKFQSVGLVAPVDAPFMFFAAKNSKACKLTALGQHYWALVKNNKVGR